MKKILMFLRSQKGLLTVGGIAGLCFVIGLFNNMAFGSNAFNEMFWWGQLATIGFFISFGIIIISFGLLPLGYAIINGIKKLFGVKQ